MPHISHAASFPNFWQRLDQNSEKWDTDLEQVLYNYNSAPSDATGEAPLSLLINRPTPPPLLMELVLKEIDQRKEELKGAKEQQIHVSDARVIPRVLLEESNESDSGLDLSEVESDADDLELITPKTKQHRGWRGRRRTPPDEDG
eukprot:Blabericola_migrator_1__2781@NODE_1795_length_3783_cov_34_944295_g1030_i1_p4_GENE_NODE_1795_length_3783_cov_34_944295_g1030_i1NODE_1795_length_3783_cov_34_944295_g1030_i1_p4_ORF_typecomplete_len145_score23_61_NODE_1795_length_3783_cov_34_944295_g1030_i16481082